MHAQEMSALFIYLFIYFFCLLNLFNVGHNTKVTNIYLQILLLI